MVWRRPLTSVNYQLCSCSLCLMHVRLSHSGNGNTCWINSGVAVYSIFYFYFLNQSCIGDRLSQSHTRHYVYFTLLQIKFLLRLILHNTFLTFLIITVLAYLRRGVYMTPSLSVCLFGF